MLSIDHQAGGNQAALKSTISPKRARAKTSLIGQSPKKSSALKIKLTPAAKEKSANYKSVRYEMKGLTEEKIELDHLRIIVADIKREKDVAKSIQSDNILLKDQLARADQKSESLEAMRQELEKVREE